MRADRTTMLISEPEKLPAFTGTKEYGKKSRGPRRRKRGKVTQWEREPSLPSSSFAKDIKISICQAMRGVAQMDFEHAGPGKVLGKRDVNTLFKSATQSRVNFPGSVGGAQNKYAP